MAEIEHQYKPTVESLHKLQGILSRRLQRDVSLEETELAYHNLIGFAFAVADMADNPSYLSNSPIAETPEQTYAVV